jgi:hypothetical protein
MQYKRLWGSQRVRHFTQQKNFSEKNVFQTKEVCKQHVSDRTLLSPVFILFSRVYTTLQFLTCIFVDCSVTLIFRFMGEKIVTTLLLTIR